MMSYSVIVLSIFRELDKKSISGSHITVKRTPFKLIRLSTETFIRENTYTNYDHSETRNS